MIEFFPSYAATSLDYLFVFIIFKNFFSAHLEKINLLRYFTYYNGFLNCLLSYVSYSQKIIHLELTTKDTFITFISLVISHILFHVNCLVSTIEYL